MNKITLNHYDPLKNLEIDLVSFLKNTSDFYYTILQTIHEVDESLFLSYKTVFVSIEEYKEKTQHLLAPTVRANKTYSTCENIIKAKGLPLIKALEELIVVHQSINKTTRENSILFVREIISKAIEKKLTNITHAKSLTDFSLISEKAPEFYKYATIATEWSDGDGFHQNVSKCLVAECLSQYASGDIIYETCCHPDFLATSKQGATLTRLSTIAIGGKECNHTYTPITSGE